MSTKPKLVVKVSSTDDRSHNPSQWWVTLYAIDDGSEAPLFSSGPFASPDEAERAAAIRRSRLGLVETFDVFFNGKDNTTIARQMLAAPNLQAAVVQLSTDLTARPHALEDVASITIRRVEEP